MPDHDEVDDDWFDRALGRPQRSQPLHLRDLITNAVGDMNEAKRLELMGMSPGVPAEKAAMTKAEFDELLVEKERLKLVLEEQECPFCKRVSLEEYEEEFCGGQVVMFEPLNPVTPGHMLFVPKSHAPDAAHAPYLTGKTFEAASEFAKKRNKPFNLITSAGKAATQTVFHLHVHYVPRNEGDDMPLPWTGMITSTRKLVKKKEGVVAASRPKTIVRRRNED